MVSLTEKTDEAKNNISGSYSCAATDPCFIDGYKWRKDKFCIRGCLVYGQGQHPMVLCEGCSYYYCPYCLRPELGLPVCLFCVTSINKYKIKYGTDKPVRNGKIICLAKYRSPDCTFFQDQNGRIYQGKNKWQQWKKKNNMRIFKDNKKNIIHFGILITRISIVKTKKTNNQYNTILLEWYQIRCITSP